MSAEQTAPAAGDDEADLAEMPDPQPGLSEADYRGCRWIDGEPAPLRRGMFCGKPTPSGSPWCAKHYRVAFGPAGRKRDDV